jgi:hypothetical protein
MGIYLPVSGKFFIITQIAYLLYICNKISRLNLVILKPYMEFCKIPGNGK